MKKDELLFNCIGYIEETRNALEGNIEALENLCLEFFRFATPNENYNKSYILIRNTLSLIYKAMSFDKVCVEEYLKILNEEEEMRK